MTPKSHSRTRGCPHTADIHPKLSLHLIETFKHESAIPGNAFCSVCPDVRLRPFSEVWLCLHCINIFCSTDDNKDPDHSLLHCTNNKTHALAICLNDTQKAWCYMCEKYFECSERKADCKVYLPQFSEVETLIAPASDLSMASMEEVDYGGMAGLRNLGNTCYMNSALQALNSCQLLTAYFLHIDAQIQLSQNPRISPSYRKFILDVWSDARSPAVSPNHLLSAFTAVNPSFRGYLQQDAQEFLRCLMEKLHEELKYLEVYDPPHHRSDHESGKPSVQYNSYISDVFNGQILSTVTCQSCNKVSKTRETFQDLSLSIPLPDQVRNMEHQRHGSSHSAPALKATAGSWLNPFSWLRYIWNNIPSSANWFVGGEAVTLENCLSNFFTEDPLTGENMYSCEKCKMLRNGIKRVRIVNLPEILCIHLKRFRHDFMHSSKMSNEVKFEEVLDMEGYTKPASNDNHGGMALSTTYTLSSVICHHGHVGGGHYIAFARHPVSGDWFECDDSRCTRVPLEYVISCQAYILFYQRNPTPEMKQVRNEYEKLSNYPSDRTSQSMVYYVSRLWLLRFLYGSNPGTITAEYLCVHGKVRPREWEFIEQIVVKISTKVWLMLDERFGHHGEPVQSLEVCPACQQDYWDQKERRKIEWVERLNREKDRNSYSRYSISFNWFRSWTDFHEDLTLIPPGPIDNSQIAVASKSTPGKYELKPRCHAHVIKGTLWRYARRLYGGGPEICRIGSDSDSEAEEMVPDVSDDLESLDSNSCDGNSREAAVSATSCENSHETGDASSGSSRVRGDNGENNASTGNQNAVIEERGDYSDGNGLPISSEVQNNISESSTQVEPPEETEMSGTTDEATQHAVSATPQSATKDKDLDPRRTSDMHDSRGDCSRSPERITNNINEREAQSDTPVPDVIEAAPQEHVALDMGT